MHEQDRQSGNPASQTGTALKNSAEGLGSVFWRHKWLILVVLAVGLAGGGVYLALVKPEYTSTSRLHVQSQSTTILKGQESPADLPLTFLPTQVELIRSQETLQSVLETIGLENLPSIRKAEDPLQALERMIHVTIPARNNLID
ncbi:MAG: Wzz/FepE/Etk N-terminal domain-containing protein, partial [Planctomycetota bacterium]